MSENPMKELNDQMVNVRLDIRELSTKVDSLADVKKEVITANKTADEALSHAKSGQHQIKELKDNLVDLKDGQKWLWRTIGSALIVGVISGAVALIWKAVVA